jgi:hypothetical protein
LAHMSRWHQRWLARHRGGTRPFSAMSSRYAPGPARQRAFMFIEEEKAAVIIGPREFSGGAHAWSGYGIWCLNVKLRRRGEPRSISPRAIWPGESSTPSTKSDQPRLILSRKKKPSCMYVNVSVITIFVAWGL